MLATGQPIPIFDPRADRVYKTCVQASHAPTSPSPTSHLEHALADSPRRRPITL